MSNAAQSLEIVGNNLQPYHERQRRGLCALHALNCLFQDGQTFSRHDLDNICYELTHKKWFNPHKNYSGFYDINVIIAALQKKTYSLIWFDKRKHLSCVDFKNVFGFVINVSSTLKFCWKFFPSLYCHWFAIRQIGGVYYNLDSKLNHPQQLHSVIDFLTPYSNNVNCHIFLVVTEQVDKDQSWLKCDGSTKAAWSNGNHGHASK